MGRLGRVLERLGLILERLGRVLERLGRVLKRPERVMLAPEPYSGKRGASAEPGSPLCGPPRRNLSLERLPTERLQIEKLKTFAESDCRE